MTALLYRWPAAAEFGRVVPKKKIYEHSAITPAVREKFVSQIQRITWAYKLADETIHLSGDTGVPEIQVFAVDAKAEDIDDDVLTVIDKAIPFPIIFEIACGGGAQSRTRMVAAHKQIGSSTPRLSAYVSTGWMPADTARQSLPPAVDLPGLYAALLTPILPVAIHTGEKMSEARGRMDQAAKIEREIAALEKRMRNERQFNRKIELRRSLKTKQAELDSLK